MADDKWLQIMSFDLRCNLAERYLWPPRPSEAIPFEEALKYYEGRSDWVAQYKFNDSRTVAWFKDRTGDVELWNRHGARADYVLPEFLRAELFSALWELGGKVGEWCAVDCGLLETRHSHPWMKDKLVIYDVLALNGKVQLGTNFCERYARILSASDVGNSAIIPYKDGSGGVNVGWWVRNCKNIFTATDCAYPSWRDMWADVGRVNQGWLTGHGDVSPVLEGLMFKKLDGKLDPMIKEKNNSSWMCRSRIETRRHRF